MENPTISRLISSIKRLFYWFEYSFWYSKMFLFASITSTTVNLPFGE